MVQCVYDRGKKMADRYLEKMTLKVGHDRSVKKKSTDFFQMLLLRSVSFSSTHYRANRSSQTMSSWPYGRRADVVVAGRVGLAWWPLLALLFSTRLTATLGGIHRSVAVYLTALLRANTVAVLASFNKPRTIIHRRRLHRGNGDNRPSTFQDTVARV